MRLISKISSRGFSLIEMLIAMALGLIVLGAAVEMYTKAMNVTWTTSQRAELQQDARAAENIIVKDISLANSGLSDSPQYLGIALATGGGATPSFGGDYTGTCHLGPANNACYKYPVNAGNNFLFGVVPGWGRGPTISATTGATDAITVVYLDTVFRLNDYQIQFDDMNGHRVYFSVSNGDNPNPTIPNPLPQPISDTAVGLQRGDLVMFLNGTSAAIAEVTAVPLAGSAAPYAVDFANNSPLGFNKDAATGGNIANTITQNLATNVNTIRPIASFTARRIWVITYYIDNSSGTPTLMRLVNGRKPVPVAENVVDLQFNYNSFDDAGNLVANTDDGGLTNAAPVMPSSIRTINLTHLTVRSQQRNKQGYQAIDLHTSVSARNMGFSNRYD